ncbi:MAG: hypothetical protein HN380_16315, partial [Victivallales bacterium]|nr:hypothetical protein [Victivallales bacterium]
EHSHYFAVGQLVVDKEIYVSSVTMGQMHTRQSGSSAQMAVLYMSLATADDTQQFIGHNSPVKTTTHCAAAVATQNHRSATEKPTSVCFDQETSPNGANFREFPRE